MKPQRRPGPLVLAIYPATTGFGFALFEGPLRPVDWGIKAVKRDKNTKSLRKVEELIDFYHPDIIIVDDYSGPGSKRKLRIRTLIDRIVILASNKSIPICGYSRDLVREYFSRYGAQSKHEIAVTIATWMPRFRLRLPRERKPWAAEGYTMCMFDAIALILTHYYFQRQRRE